MADAWTWLALAGAGALHGLNPIAGWGLVAAADAGPGARARALPALAPIALGHAVGVALMAGGFTTGTSALAWRFAAGTSLHDGPGRWLAAGALLVLLSLLAPCHLPSTFAGGFHAGVRRPLRRVALAAWSCAMSLGHGAGLMLVPMMMATCSVGAASSGVWTIAAVAAVHTSAMLATSAVLALAGRRVAGRWLEGLSRRLGFGPFVGKRIPEGPDISSCEARGRV